MRGFLVAAGATAAVTGLVLTGCTSSVTPKGRPQLPLGTSQAGLPSETTTLPSLATPSAPPPVTRTLNKTGWFGGFAITAGKVTLTPNAFGGASVTVELTYKNLTDQNAMPSDAGYLALGAQVVNGRFDSPTVPGLGQAPGTFTASLPVVPGKPYDATVLDSAALTYGQASDNQTSIPLSESAPVSSVAPKPVTATGTLHQAQVVTGVVSGALAPSYQSGEKGKAVLTLRIKVSCGNPCNPVGVAITRSDYSLKGPDGASVVADNRSGYCCDDVAPGLVNDKPENTLAFVVPLPGTGSYTLRFDDKQLDGKGGAGSFTFTV